ncbi:MAG: PHP domain-containing protein [Clostridia bacterium]|nr:PHP domain-containing protein [Clostridia bacterium]
MEMRQGAFSGVLLKGALHAHTTRSDGLMTPEALLEYYESLGYDFVALTDHRKYNRDNFGSRLIVLPGMELDVCFAGSRGNGRHTIHTVCLGPADGGDFQQDESFPSFDIDRPEDYQPTLDEMHRRGCLTMYCHPRWSHTPVHEYMGLKGNFAMELYNSGTALENDIDTDNSADWEAIMDSGVRIFGTAVDDCHYPSHVGLGFVMVRAESNAASILEALEKGNFYSSCGPEIYDFRVEGNEAVILCGPADHVLFSCSYMPQEPIGASPLASKNEVRMPIPHYARYVRATVVRKGKKAWTNPIWLS